VGTASIAPPAAGPGHFGSSWFVSAVVGVLWKVFRKDPPFLPLPDRFRTTAHAPVGQQETGTAGWRPASVSRIVAMTVPIATVSFRTRMEDSVRIGIDGVTLSVSVRRADLFRTCSPFFSIWQPVLDNRSPTSQRISILFLKGINHRAGPARSSGSGGHRPHLQTLPKGLLRKASVRAFPAPALADRTGCGGGCPAHVLDRAEQFGQGGEYRSMLPFHGSS
jgi:hypothetical protein